MIWLFMGITIMVILFCWLDSWREQELEKIRLMKFEQIMKNHERELECILKLEYASNYEKSLFFKALQYSFHEEISKLK